MTGLAAGTTAAVSGLSCTAFDGGRPASASRATAADLARDEAFWREIATHYDRTEGILNLEHGYWGKMAHPVQTSYQAAIRRVNAQNSFYARKDFDADDAEAARRVAVALGAEPDEIAITRNATEACHNLILQYRGLAKGDAVLLADIDYPGFKPTMRWLKQARGARVVEIAVPSRATQAEVRDLYFKAFETNPDLKLILITHVSNQHGLVVPVRDIADEARRRGIDVICDAAQSWGLLDFAVPDLGVDWAAFNLHKWIGAPVGTGALYMRRGTLDKIAPYPGEQDSDNTSIAKRIHSGTINFAARLAIPAALDFHERLGSPVKEARLRYLRSLWTTEAEQMPQLEVLGGKDEASWTGIGSFRLKGQASVEDAQRLQLRLEQDFGIFTVVRKGLASGACVRVTPQVFSSPAEIGQLVAALERLGG